MRYKPRRLVILVLKEGTFVRSRWLIFIFLWSLLLKPALTHAQADAIAWEIVPGYDGALRAGAWSPLTVTIANSGPDIRGSLSVRFRTGESTLFSQPVDLARGAQKRLVLPILGENNNGITELDVTLRDNGRVVQSQRVNVDVLPNAALVIGLLSDEPGVLPELANIRGAEPFGSKLLRLTSATLPERAELLQTLNILFVHNIDTSSWSDAQRSAIYGWINNGGQLVVGGDVRATGGLADMLPAQVQEIGQTGSLNGLGKATRWRVRPEARDVPLLQLTPNPDADVVASTEAGTPLVIRQPVGIGMVVQTAFGLETLRDAGEPGTFWPRILQTNQDQTPVWQQLRENGFWTLQNALELPALRLPSVLGMLGFLLVYILTIGPLNYLLLRRFDRREWAYVTIPLLVLVFSGGAYFWGTTGRGRSVIANQLAIVRVLENRTQGQATTFLTLFSPSRRTYELGTPSDVLLSDLQPPWERQGAPLNIEYAEASVRVPELLIDVGAVRALAAEQLVTVPLLEATVRSVDGKRQVTLRNRGDAVLDDIVLSTVEGQSQYIGLLEAGDERTVDFEPLGGLGDEFGAMDGRVIDRQSVMRQLGGILLPLGFTNGVVLPGGMVAPIAPEQERFTLPEADELFELEPRSSDTVYVLAWQERAPLDVRLDESSVQSSGETLYVWPAQEEE